MQAAAKRKAEEEARLEAEAARKAEAEAAKRKAEADAKLAAQQAKQAPTVIAMAPANEPATKPEPRAIDSADLAKQLQLQLKRVGCDPGALDGAWNDKSTQAMAQFNAHAHTKLEVKVASIGALEAVKEHKARVCPVVCGKGYRPEGDRCVAIACKRGFVRSKNGECVSDTKAAARPSTDKGNVASTCAQMHNKVKCTCAVQNGGYIVGSRWYPGGGRGSHDPYYKCLLAHGIQ